MNNILKLLFILISLFISLNANTITGATKGEFSVNQGSAVYNLEIITPKGEAGLKPSLSISYNSSNGANGLLGVGFSLNGLSTISKCNQTLFSEKSDNSRDYNYCLDGQKLVLKSSNDTYGSNTEYKTEFDNYSQIQKEADGWIVNSKDGLRYEYGVTDDSKDTNQENKDIIFRVNKIKDRYENEINFSYDTTTKAISKITYANNQIDFIYEDREDKKTVYKDGIEFNLNKRLKEIAIKTSSIITSTYTLNYQQRDNKSILTDITECTDNKCLEPIVFEWNSIDYGFGRQQNWYKGLYNRYKAFTHNIDMNGDGLVDGLSFNNEYNTKKGYFIELNTGYNFRREQSWGLFQYIDENIYFPNPNKNSLFDINGDGLLDAVYNYKRTWFSSTYGYWVQINTGSGFTAFQNWGKNATNQNQYQVNWSGQSIYLDINGDGLPDRVHNKNFTTGEYAYWVQLNTGSGFEGFKRWGKNATKDEQYKPSSLESTFLDINGDGLPDRLHSHNYDTGEDGYWVQLNTGNGFTEFKNWGQNATKKEQYSPSYSYSKFIDINGDGLVDRYHHYNFNTKQYGNWVQLNTGSGFTDFQNWGQNSARGEQYYPEWGSIVGSRFIDINADGLPDRVHNYNYATRQYGYWVEFNTGSGFSSFQNIEYMSSFSNLTPLKDFNGDGIADRFYTWIQDSGDGPDSKGYFIKLSKFKPLQIQLITNNKNQNIQIEYTNLQDKSIYTSTNDLSYPNREIKGSPMRVVKNFTTIDGIGGSIKTSYKYENFGVNLERGSLGFEKIETFTDVTKTKAITTYNQTFPFVGTVKSNESYINNKLISKLDTEYINVSSKPNIYQIQTSTSVTKTYDYNSQSLLTTKTTLNEEFDEYGNIGKITTTTTGDGNTYTKTVENTYTNDETNWILARLTNATVTHSKTGFPDIVKSSAFEYDPTTGTLISEIIEPTNANKKITNYTYYSNGNKKDETFVANGKEYKTSYTYDSTNKNIATVTNTLGHTVTKTYYANDLVHTITDPNGLVTTFTYDAMGRKVKQINPDDTYKTWSHSWDESVANSSYKVVEQSFSSNDIPLPPITTYFDKFARKVKIEHTGFDGRKVSTLFEYNQIGKIYKESTPHFEGETLQYMYTYYDDIGRIVKITKPSTTGGVSQYLSSYNNFKVTKTDPRGFIKTITYDAQEKKIKVEDAVGTANSSFIEYTYDAVGNLIQTIDSKGNSIVMDYDIFGNKIYMNDPDMGEWTYEYNATGKLFKQTDAKGQVTLFDYDDLGRKIEQKEYLDGSLTNALKISSWTYDNGNKAIGKLSLEESSNGIKKEYSYDDLGRLNNNNTQINKNNIIESYNEYFTYDTFGRVATATQPNNLELEYTYNEYGYNTSIRTLKANIINFDEVQLDEMISDTLASEVFYQDEFIKLKADIAYYENQLETYINQNATQALIEQVQNDITSLKVTAQEYYELAKDSKALLNHLTSLFTLYNNNISDPFGKQSLKFQEEETAFLNYKLTLENSISVETNQIKQSKLQKQLVFVDNRLEDIQQKITNATQIQTDYLSSYGEFDLNTYQYHHIVLQKDAQGRDIKFVAGNGAITINDYHYSGILNSTKTGYQDSQTYFRDLVYTYDDNQNLNRREDNKLQTTHQYTYDSLDRIQSANITTKDDNTYISYVYDSTGNITYRSDVGTYSYDTSRPHAVSSINGEVNKNFEYDANGNMTRNHLTHIEYNTSNKPVKIYKDDNSVVTTFKYDMNGNRFENITNGKKIYYIGKTYEKIYNSDNSVEEKNYIYANNQVLSIVSKKNSEVLNQTNFSYLHYDNLGSVDTITNHLGVVEQRMAYKPFGDRLALDKNGNNIDKALLKTPRGFTGHEHLDEFNLIHMNGRVYDPTIGRFLSADPHIQAPYDTQSYNRYTYVKNNPLKYTDPSGFFFKKIFKKIKKWIKPIVAIAAGILTGGLALAYMGYTSIAAAISAGAWGAVIGSAAIGGFVSGAIMTGSVGGALKGALWAGISAGVAYGIGHGGEILKTLRNAGNGAGRYIMHGISRAAIAKAQGGRWSSGFLSGLLSSASGSFRDVITKGNYYANVAFSSIVGGTVSEISGGKFANGAVSGAFIYMYNDAIEDKINSSDISDADKKIILQNYRSTKQSIAYDKIKSNDVPLEDASYVLLPVTKIAVRDAWNFQLSNASANNQLIVDAIESYPLGIPSSSWTGYVVGGEGLMEDFYYKVKNYFSPKSSGYDPNDKSVPQ